MFKIATNQTILKLSNWANIFQTAISTSNKLKLNDKLLENEVINESVLKAI